MSSYCVINLSKFIIMLTYVFLSDMTFHGIELRQRTSDCLLSIYFLIE
jgi:hypothetical protein